MIDRTGDEIKVKKISFKKENEMRMPNPWNIEDATKFITIAK